MRDVGLEDRKKSNSRLVNVNILVVKFLFLVEFVDILKIAVILYPYINLTHIS